MRNANIPGNAEIELQYQYQASSTNHDTAGLPSEEASGDPAPTRHEPENDDQRAREKSKYEASAVYKARKGDRFS